jgi:hypothetical protein
MSTPKYPDKFSFRSTLRATARDMNERSIAVHTLRGLVRRQEDVFSVGISRGIGDQKAKAVPMNREPAGNVVGSAAGYDKVTGAKFNKQPFLA